jgi:hydrocephalus-inducing protein
MHLMPSSSASLKVDFDPTFKVDRVSGVINGKITVVHAEHPHSEHVELVGEICFPNIQLEYNIINFGSILNDTSKKVLVAMNNISEMPVTYEWAFVEEEGAEEGLSPVPINEVFDILPLSGTLDPGCSEDVEFVYYAYGGVPNKTNAICNIEGGPSYEVQLLGDSSLITGKILPSKEIELGEVRFCDYVTKEIVL